MIITIRINKDLKSDFKSIKQRTLSRFLSEIVNQFVTDYKSIKHNKNKVSAMCFELISFQDKDIKDAVLSVSIADEILSDLDKVCNELNMDKADVVRALISKKVFMSDKC